jgi:hypothetical protein
LRIWIELGAPLLIAHTRCRLALLLADSGEAAAAEQEHQAAMAIFDRVEAPLARARCEERFATVRSGRRS